MVASVPWGIGPQGALTTGAKSNVMAGSSFEVMTMWRATNGQQRLQVTIDPSGNQLRNTSSNRKREIAINVAGGGSNVASGGGSNVASGGGSNVASGGDPMQNQSTQPPMQNQPMQPPMQQGQNQSVMQQIQQQILQQIQQQFQQAGAGAGLVQGAQPGIVPSGPDQVQQQVVATAPPQDPPQGAPAIVLEITNFSITPPAPNVGDNVEIRATIRNAGTGHVASVPWGIIGLQGGLTMGTQTDVAAGSSFDIVATSQATQEGPNMLRVIIDPIGTLTNTAPTASRFNERNISIQPAGSTLQQK